MESNWQERTQLLLGKEKLLNLQEKHVLIAGLGGVGGFAAESLCRAGVGRLSLVDADVVSTTNRNRQLLALKSTEGKKKIDIMEARLKDINPAIELQPHDVFLKDESIGLVLDQTYDYVVDAIDTLSPKVFLIKECVTKGLKLISSMGSGGKLDPTQVRIADLSESYGCPFARILRKKLHGWDIRSGFQVVFSPEPVPQHAVVITDNEPNKKSTTGTISYMPALFGLMAASVVIRELIGD